jgi:ubiquinone/menaquinone biosynthesis C-methylase UbiE
MDWHSRFLQQAAWTRELRTYLFERAGLIRARRILEVGCGTGAVLSSLVTPAVVHGLDLDCLRLVEARQYAANSVLACGNALALPYQPGVFDITFCHYLLLWVKQPSHVLSEMKRVTRPGGVVLALAEPDYSARVDKPDELIPLGRWQAESLKRQGADPVLGKQLADLFREAGIVPIETGPIRGSPGKSLNGQSKEVLLTPAERTLEWEVLEADLADSVPAEDIHRMKILDEHAWERGERVLQVPTYFAWGVV